MPLRNPEQSGFLITSIDGLGPGDADISTTELSATDGSVYNSSRIVSRNIVISLKYLFKETIEDVRHLSYKYFPLGKPVVLLIETDNRLVEILGYVESNDPDIFSENESTQISIICPNPFFYSVDKENTIFSGIEALFTFPFCNNSVTEKLLIMGEIRTKYENVVVYEGDAETGMRMYIHLLGPASNITIYNVTSRKQMRLNTDKIKEIVGSPLQSGDDILINTNVGEKSVTLMRYGIEYNILNALDRYSDWLKLEIGYNILAFTAEDGNENLQFRIENDILYEGV